jgi:hypothetical protein
MGIMIEDHDRGPRSPSRRATFAGEPALPMTRCPRSFVICQASDGARGPREQDHVVAARAGMSRARPRRSGRFARVRCHVFQKLNIRGRTELPAQLTTAEQRP